MLPLFVSRFYGCSRSRSCALTHTYARTHTIHTCEFAAPIFSFNYSFAADHNQMAFCRYSVIGPFDSQCHRTIIRCFFFFFSLSFSLLFVKRSAFFFFVLVDVVMFVRFVFQMVKLGYISYLTVGFPPENTGFV